MVTVAAMPNTVVMDMAKRMLTMLALDMKLAPFRAEKMTKHSTSAMTAAQSSRKWAAFFVLFFSRVCIIGFLLMVIKKVAGLCFCVGRGAAYGVVHDLVLRGVRCHQLRHDLSVVHDVDPVGDAEKL